MYMVCVDGYNTGLVELSEKSLAHPEEQQRSGQAQFGALRNESWKV